MLKQGGFTQFYVVKEQEKPDGVPTVESPNPEDSKAFALGKKLADEMSANLVLANDRADRLAFLFANEMVLGVTQLGINKQCFSYYILSALTDENSYLLIRI